MTEGLIFIKLRQTGVYGLFMISPSPFSPGFTWVQGILSHCYATRKKGKRETPGFRLMSPLLWQPLLMPEFPSASSSRPVHRIHPLGPPGPLYLLWSHGRLWVPSPRTPGAAGDLRNWPHVLKTPMVISRTLVLHHTGAYWSTQAQPLLFWLTSISTAQGNF